MACEFQSNPFCSRLSSDDRETLCENCQIYKFSKKMVPEERCKEVVAHLLYPEDACSVLILRGMILTSTLRNPDVPRAFVVFQVGDFMNPERIFGESDSLQEHNKCHYMSEGAYAIFSTRILRNLFLSSPQFASQIFQSVAETQIRQSNFFLETYLQDAYSALVYILLLCKEKNIKPLTHEELALMTNLNRTTVTKTLKKIFANENLNISLSDYIKKREMEAALY